MQNKNKLPKKALEILYLVLSKIYQNSNLIYSWLSTNFKNNQIYHNLKENMIYSLEFTKILVESFQPYLN